MKSRISNNNVDPRYKMYAQIPGVLKKTPGRSRSRAGGSSLDRGSGSRMRNNSQDGTTDKKRHAELRKQIAEKERQLLETTKSAQRLRQKLGASGSIQTLKKEEPKRSRNQAKQAWGSRGSGTQKSQKSPAQGGSLRRRPSQAMRDDLKNKLGSPINASTFDRYKSLRNRSNGNSSNGQPQKNKSIEQSYLNTKSNHSGSPLRKRSHSPPVRDTFGPPQVRDVSFDNKVLDQNINISISARRSRVDILSMDNQSLQKRLNLVMEELQSLQRDKHQLQSKFQTLMCENQQADLVIRSTDPVDQQNRNFQSQIQVAKRDNERTQADIRQEQDEIGRVEQKTLGCKTTCKQLEIQLNGANLEFKDMLEQLEVLYQRKEEMQRSIGEINLAIDQQSKLEHLANLDNIDADTDITKLQAQRNKLLMQFENITIEFDHYVRDVAVKTERLNNKNTKNIKNLVAKIIFKRIEKMQYDRKEEAYLTFKNYCQFDEQCYAKLKQMNYVLLRLGQYKKSNALQVWYDNALKPFGTRKQNYSLANQNSGTLLKSKCFHAWCKYHQTRISIYKSKADSITLVWSRLVSSVTCDIKRSLAIWKEKTRFESQKSRVYKRLILIRKKQLTSQAVLTWKNWSMRLESEVRCHLLKTEYAQKVYLGQVFAAIKYYAKANRHFRELKQRNVIKLLQENVSNKRFMMRLNLATLRFKDLNVSYHKKVCFNALRENKEKNKLQIMTAALNEDMDVTLEKYAKYRHRLENEIIIKMKLNVCNVIRTALGRRVFAYFRKWKTMTQQYRETCRSKLKDQVCFAYRQNLIGYFLHWRKNASKMTILAKKDTINRIIKINSQREREALENDYHHNIEIDVLKSISHRKNNKILRKYLLRIQQQAISIWYQRLQETKISQEKQKRIFQNMINRLLGQSFGRYKTVYLKFKQHQKNLKKSALIRQVLENKSKQAIFDAYCAYIKNFKKAKFIMLILMGKIEIWQKKKTFKTWIENGNIQVLNSLNLKVLQNIAEIEDKNKFLGIKDQQHQSKLKEVESYQKQLKLKSRKLLANYLQRYYSENTAMRFKHWKLSIVQAKERESILKRTISHMKKYQFIQVRNAFKHFMTLETQHMRKCKIRHTIWEQDEQIQQARYNLEVHEMLQIKQKRTLELLSTQQNKYRKQFNTSVESMSIKNIDNLMSSRKRKMFESWRQIAIQNKAFLLSIKNVLEKSMFMKGFVYIKNSTRFSNNRDKLMRHMNMIFLKYTKHTTCNYFSLWKQNSQTFVVYRAQKLSYDNQVCIDKFSNRINNIKSQNTKNVFEYLEHRRIANVFKSWKNIKAHLKLKLQKEKESKEILANIRYRRSLQKWFMRTEATKRRRFCLKALKQQRAWGIKRAVMDRLMWRKALQHDISGTIAHLEHLLRSKNQVDSFQTIKCFAYSKAWACHNFKKKSALNCGYLLINIHNNRLKRAFSKYKSIVKRQKFNDIMKKKIMLKIDNFNLRDAFRVWGIWSHNLKFCKELNETGPITEYVFEAKRTMYNLIDFMRSEHYDEETITYWVKYSINANDRQMDMLVKTIKIPRQNRERLLKVMNQWKMWIKMKRLFKYHIVKANASVTSVVCDMRWAFDQWKKADSSMATFLDRHDFKTIKSVNIKQAKVLDQLAEREAENSAVISHLNVQRDELLDKFLIAQKLALSLFSNNRRKDLEQCFSKWKKFKNIASKADAEAQIYDAVQRIAYVKAKAVELQGINNELSQENDNLRQYTLDGFHVAKDVQLLSNQRDSLKYDVEAKDETIQRLLDDNRLLRVQLEALGVNDFQQVGTKANRFSIAHKPLRDASPNRI